MAYIYELILSRQEVGTIINTMLVTCPNEVSLNAMLCGIYSTMTEQHEKYKIPQYAMLSIVNDKKDIGR